MSRVIRYLLGLVVIVYSVWVSAGLLRVLGPEADVDQLLPLVRGAASYVFVFSMMLVVSWSRTRGVPGYPGKVWDGLFWLWSLWRRVRVLEHLLAHAVVLRGVGAVIGDFRFDPEGVSSVSFQIPLVPYTPRGLRHRVRRLAAVQAVEKRLAGSKVAQRIAEGVSDSLRAPMVTAAALAPFCLPLFTLPWVMLRTVAPAFFPGAIEFLIGFTLALHIVELPAELLLSQHDVELAGGVLVTLGIVALANLVYLAMILGLLRSEFSAIPEVFRMLDPFR